MAHPDTSLAALLPGYDVTRELGRGAMGVVYLGRHRHLERDVAIKELVGALAADPDVRSRFRAEAKILATLNHPHIVPVYDYVEHEGRCVLVMEAVPGGTVWDRFVADGLTLAEACAMTLATCSAVQHAHDHGVLHRDIKPENLLLGAGGALRVADFGIAKVLNGARTLATVNGSVLGTPAYMSPEQAEGAPVGPPTDVYAIGTMLYEFVSGRLPFDGDSPMTMLVQRIAHRPPALSQVAPAVPPAIADVVMRAIEPDPSRRLQTPEALGRELAVAATASLGAGWLARTAIEVDGSPVLRASLAAAATEVPASAARPDAARPDAARLAATVAPRRPVDGELASSASTVAPISPRPAAEPSADASVLLGARATGSEAADAPTRAPEPATTAATAATVVRPRASSHDAGFDAAVIRRSDLVPIAQVVRRPGRPWPALVLGLAATAAAVVFAISAASTGSTDPGSTDPGSNDPGSNASEVRVESGPLTAGIQPLDLDEPFVISGFPQEAATARLTLRLAGVRVASADPTVVDGRAEVDLGVSGYLIAGALALDLDVRSPDGTPITTTTGVVTANRPWYLSGIGIALVVFGLFAAAAAESQFDVLHRGRLRVKTLTNLAAAGALLGGVGAALHGVVTREPLRGNLVALAAAAAAVGLTFLGVARAGFARRSRHRRAARARSERRATRSPREGAIR